MNGVNATPDAQVGNEEGGIWHKRLRLRKTSFSFPAEQNTVKEEENATAHGPKETKKKDCLFTCEICDDDVQQTLPQLTKHCQTHHSLNGQYYCPKCELSVQEIERFVCHSCSAQISHDESIKLENNLLKHMAAACRQRWSRRNWWRKRAPTCMQDNDPSQEFKSLLPKPEPQWASHLLPLSTPGLLDNQGMLLNPEKTLEETQQFLERTVSGANKWPISLKSEHDLDPLAATTLLNAKQPHPGLRHAGKDKLTGLMEKNNISVPPDCTTKVVGFKMVDGKKHLVLKVIPTNKQDVSTVKPTQDESNDVNASGNCSQAHVTSIRPSSNDVNASGNCSQAQATSRRSSSNDVNASGNCSQAQVMSRRSSSNDVNASGNCSQAHVTSIRSSSNDVNASGNCSQAHVTSIRSSSNDVNASGNCSQAHVTSRRSSSNDVNASGNCSQAHVTSIRSSSNDVNASGNCSQAQVTSIRSSSNDVNASGNCSQAQTTSIRSSSNDVNASGNCSQAHVTSIRSSSNDVNASGNCSQAQTTSIRSSSNDVNASGNCSQAQVTSIRSSSNDVNASGNCSQAQVTSIRSSSNDVNASGNCSQAQATSIRSSSNDVNASGNCSQAQVTPIRSSSNDVNASGNCSQAQVMSRRSSSQRKKEGRCEAQRDFLTSVVERIKSQQKDGCNNQEPAECNTPINRNMRAKDSQDKALSESEENLAACQGDSGCHSDLTSDSGSLEERCGSRLLSAAFDKEHNLALDSNADSCSISGFDCISPSSRSPLKDLTLTESLCHFQSEDEGLLFHSRADERTNNTDPRDALVPVGQRETCGAPDLMVDELPLTTVSHLLDELRVDQTSSSHSLPDLTCTGGTIQRSDPVDTGVLFPADSNSSTSREPNPSLASLSRKRMREGSSTDSHRPAGKSHKRSADATVLHWQPVAPDVPTVLRLIPHSSSQSVRIPRGLQPVIVLNHPHADVPEVANIMKVVHQHKEAVQRVALSRKTLRALSGVSLRDSLIRREWPIGTVQERFSLKLRLKRVCGRKYTVVPTASESVLLQPTFTCWFCGRVFRNQEAWVGHGQRHLMEATRGWDQLFHR